MAAVFVEDESQNVEDTSFDDVTQVEQTHVETEEDIPDKYRGKSIQDIVRMHQEAEKAIGRQSAEVGDLRGVVDHLPQHSDDQ